MASIESHYQVILNFDENRVVEYFDTDTKMKFNFKGHALAKKNMGKLYVVKDGTDFLYVGTTFQPLKSRLRYGFYADGKNGYHGYHWKDRIAVQMHIWCFADIDKKHLEGIEAELVFCIRTQTEKWPLDQTEIHFNNHAESSHQIAEQLYVEPTKNISTNS